ncbi:YcxB family protein [Acidaminobacter sp. JC074]|uniref:YcxB family protein n=1 Tax=Acidaminobacter sp. JC074 TaxID=2530199 RepID=UPI001F0EA182|nr:YcxB family protein [Acidaminobacter sp. JC074]MCH4890150.1 YcxB family protein [Acidaminobacter sp. JC074]
MKINYTLTAKDYIDFNIYHMNTSKTMKRNIMFQRLMGPLIFTIFTYIAYRLTNISLMYWSIVFLIASVIWFFVYPSRLKKRLIKHIVKLLSEDENRGLLGDKVMELGDEGIIVTDQFGKNSASYSVLSRIEKTDEHIFAFNSAVSAYIIPLSAFENDSQVEAFIEELKNRG